MVCYCYFNSYFFEYRYLGVVVKVGFFLDERVVFILIVEIWWKVGDDDGRICNNDCM